MVVIEGIKEIDQSIRAGYKFEAVFFFQQLIDLETVSRYFGISLPKQIYMVNEEVFGKIAYRESSGGLVALAHSKPHDINSLTISANPLILVIEGVEKPGNLGAIYRTADAAGIDAILICDPKTDLYNPNAIRASLGCIFTVQTALTTSPEAIHWLNEQDIRIYCTSLQASVPYYTVDFTKPSAIVMGTEATGISEIWRKESHNTIIIPMHGETDSMNVSTSAAVVVFEARRQRNLILK
jgi:TrmH family RNA methyltransferase